MSNSQSPFPLIRHLSRAVTPLLMALPFTANQVTAASLLAGLGSAWMAAQGTARGNVWAGLLMVLCYVLDNCDGDVARAKNLSSRLGHYFDSVADWLVDSAFFAGLGVGTAAETGDDLWLWLGLAASGGATVSYLLELGHDLSNARALRRSGAEPEVPPLSDAPPANWREAFVYAFRELSRADFCFIVLILVAVDQLWILLPLGAIGAQVYWLTSLVVGWRRFHV